MDRIVDSSDPRRRPDDIHHRTGSAGIAAGPEEPAAYSLA